MSKRKRLKQLELLSLEWWFNAYKFFMRYLVSEIYLKDLKNVVVLGDGFVNNTYVVLVEEMENKEMIERGNQIDCREL